MRFPGRVACLLLWTASCRAWDPPSSTAGPLTVSIEGPASLSAKTPAAYTVVLANSGAGWLAGTIRSGGADDWRVTPDWLEFRLAAGETQRIPLTLAPAPEAHAAHYPLHVWAAFESGGRRYTAHPVLVIETTWNPRPSPLPAPEWKPWRAAPASGLALWRLPVHRTVIQVFGQAPFTMPVGWQGSESGTSANVALNTRVTRGDSREAIAIHPPWSGGRAGTAWVEFPLQLPASLPLRIRFAHAVRDPTPGQTGDGVTFRVRVDDQVVFERHTDSKVWVEGEADLSAWAGRPVLLQLESHPGPARNTSFDSSYWAEPTLLAGSAGETPPEETRSLGHAGEWTVAATARGRGLFDADFSFTSPSRRLSFRGFSVRAAGQQLDDWRSPYPLLEVLDESGGGVLRLRHRFEPFDALAEAWIQDEALKVRWRLENTPAPQAWRAVYLEDVAAGPWDTEIERIYAGDGNVLVRPEAFRLTTDGHRLSTRFIGFDFSNGVSLVQATDSPPHELDFDPAARRATLRAAHDATFRFHLGPDVWTAAKQWRATSGLVPAAGVAQLAGRYVFDLWSGRYADAAASLRRAALYGLRDGVVVWHNWQRWGYDYRLPEIFPPNPALGAEEDFASLASAARDAGHLFAPHDNYIDLYPDAEGFTYSDVAHDRNGRPLRAWLNESRQAQSYRWFPGRFAWWLGRNVEQLRDAFHPSAYFIDVWSSAGPAESYSSGGEFMHRSEQFARWGESFAWIRDFLGGTAPQISESGHDLLIGWLDGAQSNHLRVDTPPAGDYGWAVWNIRARSAERIPWFDFAHHDRFVKHGAGYESRYASGLDPRLHGIASDDYMATEFLTGHPAMVGEAFSRTTVRKVWLMESVGRALARRRIDAVEFVAGDLHRQRVLWDNGGVVYVNRGAADWIVEGHWLPPYGVWSRIPVHGGYAEAAIERRDGLIVEWSRDPLQLFVNARPPASDRLAIRTSVESVECSAPRRCTFTFRWDAEETTPVAARIFVHFVDETGAIRFQGDHDPPIPSNQWQGSFRTSVVVTVPDSIPAGAKFELRLGLYQPGTGRRFAIEGSDDGTTRVRLGTVQVGTSGLLYTARAPETDPLLERMNPQARPVRFPALTTNAGLRLTPLADGLRLTLLPGSREGAASIDWDALPWRLPRPARASSFGTHRRAPPVSR